MLASAVPNNGSAVVNVPNIDTTSARVRVRCSNNIFFAMSANNFSIVGNDVLFADGFETAGGPAAPSLIKVFGPSAVVIDTPSTLTITLVNTNANAATLTAPLTDTFGRPRRRRHAECGDHLQCRLGDRGGRLGGGAVHRRADPGCRQLHGHRRRQRSPPRAPTATRSPPVRCRPARAATPLPPVPSWP